MDLLERCLRGRTPRAGSKDGQRCRTPPDMILSIDILSIYLSSRSFLAHRRVVAIANRLARRVSSCAAARPQVFSGADR